MRRVEGETADQFMNASLLSEVDPDTRRALLEALVEEHAKAGSMLLVQGQPNDHLSFLMDGSATVERSRGDGHVEAIVTLDAPSIFGTTSFFRPNAPSFGVRAASDVRLLTLHHEAHERLRKEHPRAAEALALAAIRIVADRFEALDRVFSEYIAAHPSNHRKVTEWAGFRARLFKEPGA